MTQKQPLDLTQSPINIDWETVLQPTTTTPTLQVVVNPMLKHGAPPHKRAIEELKKLQTDYTRFVPWFPYPKYAIAELYAPEDGKANWDFEQIDPFTIDFLEATKGHSVMLNFSTIPPWMFKAEEWVPYPEDPDQPIWHYQVGTELRDPSLKEVADYFARIVGWYTKGGFEDEFGVWHASGHHYDVAYWEVLNEPDFEHDTTPKLYTERYDAIVEAIRKMNPEIKFVGMSLALPSINPEFFEYFLNPKNHKPGIPLDMISYHFYASPERFAPLESEEITDFIQADAFLNTVRYAEVIRKRLSPHTQTTINEIGVIRGDDGAQGQPGHVAEDIPAAYWNLAGAVYAYVFAGLAEQGIEVAGESQLMGYPSQFPSVTMVDWNTGAPNARMRVLELLKTHLSPLDAVIKTNPNPFSRSRNYRIQAFRGADGSRKLLLVSMKDVPVKLRLPGFAGASAAIVDQETAGGPLREETLTGEEFVLPGYAVAVLSK